MKRRAVLAGTVTAALAGCLSDDSRPTEIEAWTPETGIDTDVGADDDPVVEADSDAATVTVEGRAAYPADCGPLEIPSPAFDSDESVLTVEAGPSDDGPDCGEDEDAESYRVTVRFDEGVPAEVVAREPYRSIEVVETFD